MQINIIRGQNQIGGNIVEIKTNTTKILLDIGCELESKNTELPNIEGLFNKYGSNKISKDQISKSKFVMCVRTSMDEYLKTLSEKVSFKGGLLIYSFWSGYKEQPEMKEFLKDCEDLGLEIITLHASGHADPQTIKELIKHTNPSRIVPIHTKNAAWFEAEYGDKTIK